MVLMKLMILHFVIDRSPLSPVFLVQLFFYIQFANNPLLCFYCYAATVEL